MGGTNKGFIGRMNAECEASNVPKPQTLQCILHQDALCGKSVDMSCVMNPPINCKEVESLSPDLPYYTAVRWLSCGKILNNSNRFSHLDAHFKAIRIFRNPLSCEIEDVQPSLQLKLTDLQANDIMKGKFKEGSLVQFYNFLPEENYQKIKDFAHSFLSILGITYRCEQTFSLLKFTKLKYRGNLSDQHLRDILLI
ncbi:hypothetical protein PR048_005026 [Dryococelus australis]|uniref:General transcription factor II-I repeat domain-containing protein 2 n=1 Tax=Dryococelus australis TaxID=614101 RepID=A0ABQ9I7Y3_9NEOP|nr:hypothetical protein PR048_005026 [Dryococelus australis]